MLEKNWLQVNITVKTLLLTENIINYIEENAFNDLQFKWLKELEFRNMPIRKLYKYSFAGLNNLEKLQFISVEFISFSTNVFATVPKMQKLVMNECGSRKLKIDNLFGTNIMLLLN